MNSFFDEIRALVTSQRLLENPLASGENVRVCVIDSGIDEAFLREKWEQKGQTLFPIAGGIFSRNCPEPFPYEGFPSTPHGTTVADIILTLAPRVQLYSADVFGPGGACDVEVVIRALHWAIHVWKCKLINLSLGVSDQQLQPLSRRHQLQRAIEEGYFRDVLIVAAAHNDHPLTRGYPALFAPPLISVDKKIFERPWDFSYRLHEQIEFEAHGRGYFGPFAQEPATSWAAPHLTGIVARLLSLQPDLKPFEVKTILYWLAQKSPNSLRPPVPFPDDDSSRSTT